MTEGLMFIGEHLANFENKNQLIDKKDEKGLQYRTI